MSAPVRWATVALGHVAVAWQLAHAVVPVPLAVLVDQELLVGEGEVEEVDAEGEEEEEAVVVVAEEEEDREYIGAYRPQLRGGHTKPGRI